jgi:hypothetical protein
LPTNDSVLFSVRFCAVHPKDAGDCRLLQFFEVTVNVTVTDGAVDLWGLVDSLVEKKALHVAVENTPGVKAVNDNVLVRPAGSGT